MYGFGDDENSYQESVEILEDLVVHFIQNMVYLYLVFFSLSNYLSQTLILKTIKCMELNKQNRVQIEDLMFILRKDPRKYARAKDLLIMNEELKKARKVFEETTKY
jgi:transcription initiation factor TFIID subunit 13